MAINLVEKYLQQVDELFKNESKRSLVTNQDYSFDGANSVCIYKVGTAAMNDYDRAGVTTGNRYGNPETLTAVTETYTLPKDRSFSFVIDRLDMDETGAVLEAAKCLARQQREVVIPEIDAYTYGIMCTDAGTKPDAVALTATNIYDEICKASAALDDAEVPETNRVLVVSPDTYRIMKKCKEIVLESDIGQNLRLQGVVSNLDGAAVQKVPANRLPAKFGFMLCHPLACTAPVKLSSAVLHDNPPGVSGWLVEGRYNYGAFVTDNKKRASIIRPPPDKTSSGRMGQPVRSFLTGGEPNP